MSNQALAWDDMSLNEENFFEVELKAILDRLYGAALRLTRDKTDAEDLVADAVTKGLEKLDTLKDRQNFRGWMFRILTNTFISNYRKQSVRETLVYDEAEDDDENPFWIFDRLHQPFLLWFSNPEQDFLNKVLNKDLETALDNLQEAYRIVVVLADLEGFKYAEISEILEVPVGTIRSRLARGRSLLQKALWQHGVDAGLVKNHQSNSEDVS
jgi:RNA polymerase sigma-70 factor (ECF subfamily)